MSTCLQDALRNAGQKLRAADPIPEPGLWFHDIFRTDGSAYDPSEVALIKAMVGKRSLPLFPSSSSSSPRTQEPAAGTVAESDKEAAAFSDSNNLYALEHIGKAGAGAGAASQKRKGVYSDSPAATGSAGPGPDGSGAGGDSEAAARASAELGRTILNMVGRTILSYNIVSSTW